MGLKVADLNDHIYLTTTKYDDRGPRMRDVQRIEILETRDRPWNKTIARILDLALDNQLPNILRDADQPSLRYAVNVGYLAPNPESKTTLSPSTAFLDAFPDL